MYYYEKIHAINSGQAFSSSSFRLPGVSCAKRRDGNVYESD